MQSKISIIIPVFNVEKYLYECVNSCINQTYKNIEVLLINDGSTDSSALICEDLKNSDERIKVIHKQNAGLSSARNVGIVHSSGDYICFLDSDDWMNVSVLEEALSLSTIYNADIVFWSFIKEHIERSQQYQVYPSSEEFLVFEGDNLNKLKIRSVGLIKEELSNPTKTDSFISAWGKLYKTTLIKENNISFLPTQEVGSEDVPFNIETFNYSRRIIFLNKFYNHYRMFNDNSLTKNHRNTLFPRYKNMYLILFEFLEKKELANVYYKALDNRLALSLLNHCLCISNPRYEASILIKFKDIRNILNDKVYQNSIGQLEISYLPYVWRFFFWLGIKKYYRLCLLITLIYRKLKM